MAAAVEGLSTAAIRLGDAHDDLLAAARALDGVSDGLFDGTREVVVRLTEVRTAVIRARDALDGAGA